MSDAEAQLSVSAHLSYHHDSCIPLNHNFRQYSIGICQGLQKCICHVILLVSLGIGCLHVGCVGVGSQEEHCDCFGQLLVQPGLLLLTQPACCLPSECLDLPANELCSWQRQAVKAQHVL